MSTFLLSFGVVAATIAAVVHVVLSSPDQPATIRRQPSRGDDAPAPRSRRKNAERPTRAAPAPAPARMPTFLPPGPTLALTDSDIMRLRVLPAGRTTLWVRVRSGFALIVLVALLGALLALAIGGLGLGLALLVRSATG